MIKTTAIGPDHGPTHTWHFSLPAIQETIQKSLWAIYGFARKAGTRISDSLITDSEPKAWQVRDHSGATYWRVYDPATNRAHAFSSEAEVRMWLEQRYYQR